MKMSNLRRQSIIMNDYIPEESKFEEKFNKIISGKSPKNNKKSVPKNNKNEANTNKKISSNIHHHILGNNESHKSVQKFNIHKVHSNNIFEELSKLKKKDIEEKKDERVVSLKFELIKDTIEEQQNIYENSEKMVIELKNKMEEFYIESKEKKIEPKEEKKIMKDVNKKECPKSIMDDVEKELNLTNTQMNILKRENNKKYKEYIINEANRDNFKFNFVDKRKAIKN